jgi:alpha-mannosidase
VTVTYSLDSGATALRVRYEIDWQEPRAMLKAHFPTQYAASHARFGTPFGSVLRPAQPGMPDEEAQWESAGSRWACVFDEGERDGLCLVTKDSYGFACYDGDLNVTLVRSPIPPEADRKRLGAVLVRDAAAYGEDPEEKLFTDIGRHTVEIAVGLYDADSPRGELPAALADTLFTPPVPYRGRPVTPPDIHLQNADHLLPCWVQPAERGTMVVRLHEVLGRHGTARLAQGTDTSRLVDLSGEIAGKAQEGRIEFGPYQVLGWVVG